MLFNAQQQEEASSNKGFNPKAVDLGKVTCTNGQKVSYMICSVLSFGIFAISQNVGKKNHLNKLQNKINESASTIEVQLENRFSTLTRMVDAISSQAKLSKEVYENIAKYRSGAAGDINEKQATINKIQSGINVVFENYPTLGTDETIHRLLTESSMMEKEIAAARRLYNANVTEFNSIIFNWPYCVRAAKLNYEGLKLFKADEKVYKEINTKFY